MANPYASKRERQEGEVAGLLDKLQPDTITLDTDTIGRVLREPKDMQVRAGGKDVLCVLCFGGWGASWLMWWRPAPPLLLVLGVGVRRFDRPASIRKGERQIHAGCTYSVFYDGGGFAFAALGCAAQEERRAAEEAANAARVAAQRAKSEAKVKMKGKNKPSRRHKKKQNNIIEEKKTGVKARMQEQVRPLPLPYQPVQSAWLPAPAPAPAHLFPTCCAAHVHVSMHACASHAAAGRSACMRASMLLRPLAWLQSERKQAAVAKVKAVPADVPRALHRFFK